MNQSIVGKRLVAVAWMLGVSTLVTTQVVDAQPRWGRSRTPAAGACFYRSPNFRGTYFCAGPGEDIAFLSGAMNNQISSIRTFGDTEVTIFQDVRFRGRWARLDGDVRDLRREGWNDQLSSVRISSGWGRDRGQTRGRRSGSGIGRIETGEWRDDRYDRGDSRDGSGARGDNPANGRDNSGEGRNNPADSRNGSGGDRNNPADRRGGSGVDRNNPADQRGGSGIGRSGSPDGRGNGGPGDRRAETADQVVRRVYQDLLQREPDAQGLTLYRNRMNNDHWSEQQVRDALLQSPEYQKRGTATTQRNAEELVARAYRAILGREPDPASRVYVDKVLREHWTEADVSRELRNSPEFKNKR